MQPDFANPTSAARDVLWELACGNKRFLRKQPRVDRSSLVNVLADNPLNPPRIVATIIGEARSRLPPMDNVFDVEPGNLHVVRVCGFAATGHLCGVTGSLEYALSDVTPKVVLTCGNSNNSAIASAVRIAMKAAGRLDAPEPSQQLDSSVKEEDLDLLKILLPAARDAVMQLPHGSFSKICTQATKLNIWNTIESFMTHSKFISDLARSGSIELHGAFVNSASGAVEFLGQHPSMEELLLVNPSEDVIRTAADPPVPAEQALAELYAGNRRYANGKGGGLLIHDQRLLEQLSESGQNPKAVVLGCADSRAPVEILFDMRPGDLFVLRTAGNTISSAKGAILGSAEYAIGNLGSKLIVVAGHTKCGAVTASVDSVRTGKPHSGFPGSIGKVLEDMHEVAAETVAQEPNSALKQQVDLATQKNVFSTMEKIIRNSEMVTEGIKNGEILVHGAVYDILSGKVEWLGPHPQLEKIVEVPLEMHKWITSPYQRGPACTPRTVRARTAIDKLKDGNRRFCASTPVSTTRAFDHAGEIAPYAVVVASVTVRVPIEQIFDAQPGELLVQRVMATLGGRKGGTIFASLEYAAACYSPAVILFMGSYQSPAIRHALKQVQGASDDSLGPKSYVLDRLMVSAMRAHQQVLKEDTLTAAGRDVKRQHLAEELNLLYSIEQVMRSPIIRSMVERGALELHAAMLDESTGELDFLGEHPMVKELAGGTLSGSL